MIAHLAVFAFGVALAQVFRAEGGVQMVMRGWLLPLICGFALLGVWKVSDALQYGFTPVYIWTDDEAEPWQRLRCGTSLEHSKPIIYDPESQVLMGATNGARFLLESPSAGDTGGSNGWPWSN